MSNSSKDMILFQRLLKHVADRFLENHTPTSMDISEWKGQDISDFQEDLRQKTKGSVSEKWFYNYVKNTPEKLPRIDILNLLAHYAGHANWSSFKTQFSDRSIQKVKPSKRKWILAIIVTLITLALLVYAFVPKMRTFHFCFVDADKKEPIVEIAIDVIVLNGGESPTYYKTDSLGCVSLRTKRDHIAFIAQSPYHKNDTIFKSISGERSHQVRLRTDDYALMLHYYGSNNVKDWKKRRNELQKLIADDAIIFELLPHQIGVELYSKTEFIDKLTTPTETLQKLQIVETAYRNGEIVKLKFKIGQ
ncbi:MAG: hypothetical protein WBG90_21705 [Saonia sp.]